jgi:acid phosphatase (class A)
MMKRLAHTIYLLVLLVPVVSGPVQAREADTRHYLPAGSVDAGAVIQPPPAVGSTAFKEQMAVVLWLQRTRTPAQVDFVQKTLDLERFAPLLEVELVRVDGIALKRVIDAAIDEVRAEYDALKGKFDLPRPFEVSDAVQPIAEARAVAAYPSGHAIRAMVYARLLSEVFPDRKQALMDLARQIGYGRVIAGVHYPMDVLAGQKLGEAYADAIVDRSQFKQAIECIRGQQPCR